MDDVPIEERTYLLEQRGRNGRDPLSPGLGGGLQPRRCTDVLCLLLFLVFQAGFLYIGILSMHEQNWMAWEHVLRPCDYMDRVCGLDAAVGGAGVDNKYFYMPDPVHNHKFGVCLDYCPVKAGEKLELNFAGKKATFNTIATTPQGSYCWPTDDNATIQHKDVWSRLVASLAQSWKELFTAAGVAIVISFIYLGFMAMCGSLLIFVSMLLVEALFIGCAYLFHQASVSHTYDHQPHMVHALQVGMWTAVAAAVIFFLTTTCFWSRIRRASKFINHGTVALLDMPILLLFPLVGFVCLALVYAWWIAVTVCMFTTGEEVTKDIIVYAENPSTVQVKFTEFQVTYHLRKLFIYNLFGLVWSSQFIVHLGVLIIALAIGLWYFSEQDDDDRRRQRMGSRRIDGDPASIAIGTVFRYHLGTVAFGSGLIAWVHLLREALLYVKRVMRSGDDGEDNVIFKIATCCCACWLSCLNCFLKYITEGAYYVTAVNGTGFLTSAKTAMELLALNLLDIVALDSIGKASIFLGKLTVVASTTIMCYFLLAEEQRETVPVIPMLVTAIFSYAIAEAFMNIYSTAINMMLICFLVDEDLHGGQGKATYAHATLTDSVDNNLRPKRVMSHVE